MIDRPSRDRRGSWILVTTVCLLAVLSCLQLAQFHWMSSVSERGERVFERRRATLLGESAIAEALSLLRVELNLPDTALGRFLANRPTPGAVANERIAPSRLPETLAIARSEPYRSLALDSCKIRLTVGEVAVGAPDYVSGTMEITAWMRSRESGAVQRVSRTHAFRRVVPCLPAPLAGATVLFRRPAYLLRHTTFINESMKSLAETVLPEELRRLDDLAAQLADLSQTLSSGGGGDPEAQAMQGWVETLRGLYEGVRRNPELATALETIKAWKPLPEDPDRTLALSRARRVELAELDLSGRFEKRWQQVAQTSQAVESAMAAADASLDQGELVAAPHERTAKAYRAWADALQALADEMTRARAALELIPDDQPEYAQLAGALAAVDAVQLGSGASPLERGATARAGADADGLTRLMDRLSRAGGETRAVVVVDGAGTTRLPVSRPGRWLVAVKGGVVVPASAETDREPWVVLAGRRDRPVRLEGDTALTLVMAGNRVDASPGTRLTGRLLALDLPVDGRGAVSALSVRRPADEAEVAQVTVSPWVRSGSSDPERR